MREREGVVGCFVLLPLLNFVTKNISSLKSNNLSRYAEFRGFWDVRSPDGGPLRMLGGSAASASRFRQLDVAGGGYSGALTVLVHGMRAIACPQRGTGATTHQSTTVCVRAAHGCITAAWAVAEGDTHVC